mgnify:CR=1 FL=1
MVYKDAVLLCEGRNLSAEMHDLGLTYAAEILDNTAFGSDTRTHIGGLLSAQLSGEAFADFSALAPGLLYDLLGLDDKVVTIFPNGITLGTESGYAMKAVQTTFDLGGVVGVIEGLKFAFESRGIES